MSLVIQAAGTTDIGLVRKNNEDNFGYDLRHGIFVVCDGMGGQQAGEVASKIAVDTVLDYFRQARDIAPVGGARFEGVSPRAVSLASAIQLANQAIHECGARNLRQAGMGSTIVAVALEDRMRRDRDEDVEIARRAAVQPGLAFAGKADSGAFLDARQRQADLPHRVEVNRAPVFLRGAYGRCADAWANRILASGRSKEALIHGFAIGCANNASG